MLPCNVCPMNADPPEILVCSRYHTSNYTTSQRTVLCCPLVTTRARGMRLSHTKGIEFIVSHAKVAGKEISQRQSSRGESKESTNLVILSPVHILAHASAGAPGMISFGYTQSAMLISLTHFLQKIDIMSQSTTYVTSECEPFVPSVSAKLATNTTSTLCEQLSRA